jgi:hypothetical protein
VLPAEVRPIVLNVGVMGPRLRGDDVWPVMLRCV